jgi:CDP-glucose 4,6-dehydratase
MNREFWQGKRVFLTGHTGFKGSWLTLWLERLGAEVTGYSLAAPTDPSLFEDAGVDRGIVSIEADIRDADRVAEAMVEARPEIVLHLAAQALVRYGYAEPLETYETNVVGTANVLEAARGINGLRAFVSCTSDKCYENREWDRGYREDDRLGGKDPYSNSKACAELVTDAFRRSYFSAGETSAAVATVRSGNVIGGGDWADDRLVPDLVRGFLGDAPVAIRSPDAIRPWQHVLDPLHGYLVVAERLWSEGAEFGEAWNFGPEESDARTVRELADRIVGLWGQGASWQLDSQVHPPEATFLRLDCAKAKERLEWRPVIAFETALEWLVDWYRERDRGGDARELTLRRIADYEALLDR